MINHKESAQYRHTFQLPYLRLKEALENTPVRHDGTIDFYCLGEIDTFFKTPGVIDKPDYLLLMLKEDDFFDFFPRDINIGNIFLSYWPAQHQLNLLFSDLSHLVHPRVLGFLKDNPDDDKHFQNLLRHNHYFVFEMAHHFTQENFALIDAFERHFKFSILEQQGNIMPMVAKLNQGEIMRWMTSLSFEFQASDMIAMNYSIEKEQFLQQRAIALPDSQKNTQIETYFQNLLASPFYNEKESVMVWLENMKPYKKRLLYEHLDNHLDYHDDDKPQIGKFKL
jgi:hypothetical protein